jgi:hypothetical protein
MGQHHHVFHHHYLYLQPHWGWVLPPQPDPYQKCNSEEEEADSEGGEGVAGDMGGQGKYEDQVKAGEPITGEPITPSRCLGLIGSEEQQMPVEGQEADTEDEDMETTTTTLER